jgi:hypothetical protein
MQLNPNNYFSPEADQYYLSNSQFKSFDDCESQALAKLRGDIPASSSEALLFGSYVHAAVEGSLETFKQTNPELFKKDGSLYAAYAHADTVVQTISNDKFIQFILQGRKEVILTAEMFGAPWKVKIDVLSSSRLVDLKTVKSITEKHWDENERRYLSFIEHYKYIQQMAIYSEVERINSGRSKWLEPLIVAISKENVPDKIVIGFDEETIKESLEYVASKTKRIVALKNGAVSPTSCGRCNWCRRHKQLAGVTHYSDLAV